jgi:4-hydroxy-tetrahydrodipicolinate synthase
MIIIIISTVVVVSHHLRASLHNRDYSAFIINSIPLTVLFDCVHLSFSRPESLMVGTGSSSVVAAQRLTGHAFAAGAAAVLVVPPFFYKNATHSGLVAYYRAVAESAQAAAKRSHQGILLYNIPQVSGVTITPELAGELAKAFPGLICGVKDSSGSVDSLARFHELARTLADQAVPFLVFSGSETELLYNMRHGGAGCISATANINASDISALYTAYTNGEYGRDAGLCCANHLHQTRLHVSCSFGALATQALQPRRSSISTRRASRRSAPSSPHRAWSLH